MTRKASRLRPTNTDGKVLEMEGQNPEPRSKRLYRSRTEETRVDGSTRKFEMFMTPPGGEETQISFYTCTRV